MTKIDIVSGFLGAGKTTLIKKLLEESLSGQKIVLIENEFGEIGVDGGFLKEAGIDIREMNSGCICCSLVGDFGEALGEVLSTYRPDRIIIEPSGVGKLSDVIRAVLDVTEKLDDVELASYTTVADAGKCKMYIKNFGEFYNNQIESAKTIILSRTQLLDEDKINKAIALLREKNAEAQIVTTPWQELDGDRILSAMEEHTDFGAELLDEIRNAELEEHDHHHEHEHDHHEHEHDHHEHENEHEHCEHHHEHDHEHCDHDHDHCEHDHDHDHEHCEHHHDHDHDETCSCGCGHHHHEGHHHADEVFDSFGVETANKYSKEELEEVLTKMAEGSMYGTVLRAKGIVENAGGGWIEFDMVPGEIEIRDSKADVTGRIVVIGTGLDMEKIQSAFRTAD